MAAGEPVGVTTQTTHLCLVSWVPQAPFDSPHSTPVSTWPLKERSGGRTVSHDRVGVVGGLEGPSLRVPGAGFSSTLGQRVVEVARQIQAP